MQTFTKPDLFVEVSAGGTYGRTEEKEGSENPVFNETLMLWPRQPIGGVPPQGPPAVTVRVFDDDVFGKDAVGVGTIVMQPEWETMEPLDTTVRPCTHAYDTVSRGGRALCSSQPNGALKTSLLRAVPYACCAVLWRAPCPCLHDSHLLVYLHRDSLITPCVAWVWQMSARGEGLPFTNAVCSCIGVTGPDHIQKLENLFGG